MILAMAPDLKPATFRMDTDILEGLEAVKKRDGIPISEQVRRALRVWLESKGLNKTDRRPASNKSKRP